VFASDEENLEDWVKDVNKSAQKVSKLADLLTEAAEKYLDLNPEDDDDAMEDDDDLLGLSEAASEKPAAPKVKKSKEEEEIDNKEFLPIGSATATMRLIKDLKSISKAKPQEMGFDATPVKEKKTGLENLYHWEVHLFGFDKGSDLAKDMDAFKKKSGQEYITLELRFTKDYPFAPPFVRVIRPRFAFRTGHVTIGGSICMELLTNSGWNSTNDIESILIQIRAEMFGGGARLDPGMSGSYEYTESEAWEAFYRAASTHGWDVRNLSKEAFPRPE